MAGETKAILDGLIFLNARAGTTEETGFRHANRKVIAVDADGEAETIAQVPGQPGGLGWLPVGL